MDYSVQKQNEEQRPRRIIARFYVILSLLAVVIMFVAAFITHGYNGREIRVALAGISVQEEEKTSGISIGADYSRIPDDKMIEKILNKNLPNTCKDCDDDILDCLDKYEINKVLVQEKGYQNHLFIEVITGKIKKKYTVVIDLASNNRVLDKYGDIDKKECFETEEEESEAKVYLNKGEDPPTSGYLEVPDPQK